MESTRIPDKGSKAITVQQLEMQLNELGKLYNQVANSQSRLIFQRLTKKGIDKLFKTAAIYE
jgi:hypothetical protein